jgi:Domain of unknown function (DUF4252)
MRKYALPVMAMLLAPALLWASSNPKLLIPEFSGLAQKATESVTITLDPGMLGMAARFLDGNDPQDAATKEVIKGLRGIYVRSYTFDKDSAYQQADIDAVRSQLATPGWNRLVQTHSRKTGANVDIYIMIDNNQAVGLAVIASEPRQFTIVNIVGAIDLDKLHKLEGQFGVPKLDIDPAKEPAQGPQKRRVQ